MAQTTVVALNGFLGNRVGLDVTDVVNPRAEAAGLSYYRARSGRPARGGAGPIAKKHFYNWCKARIIDKRTIVMVGKSYGAHWILDAIQDLGIGSNVHALVFDPTSVLHPRECYVRPLTEPHDVTVIRQLGPRSGYQVAGAKDFVIAAKHSNIERTRQGRCMLDEWLAQHGL